MTKVNIKGKINFFENLFLSKEKDYFFTNLSMLLEAGMTVVDSISALAKETHSRPMQRILAKMMEDVENGFPLSQALLNNGLASTHTASIIRVGEESGRLAQNLKIIALSEEKNRDFRSKIRSAMVYPMFVFGVTIIVGLVVVWFILPRLASVFAQLDVTLPPLTRGLITLGAFLGQYGAYVIPGVIVLLVSGFYFLFYFPKTKHIGSQILFGAPGIGKVLQEIELAHMGHILGTLLSSGIPVVAVIDSLVEATTSRRHKLFYTKIKESISEGNSFARTFDVLPETHKFIPVTIVRLIMSGEQSGKLADTFMKISAHYESKVDNTTKNLSVIFEPVLLVIVWFGVVLVALAVILPIYSLVGNFNQ